MPSKLKIRMGHIEFEYEGDAQFDTEAIKDLFTHLESLVGITPAAAFDVSAAIPVAPVDALNGSGVEPELNYSPNTIAARLNATTGPDLLLAAAAYLQLVKGHESFQRQAVLDTMKIAKTYYKANMRGNLSKMISTLVGAGRINELANSEFSLSATEQTAIRTRLAAE